MKGFINVTACFLILCFCPINSAIARQAAAPADKFYNNYHSGYKAVYDLEMAATRYGLWHVTGRGQLTESASYDKNHNRYYEESFKFNSYIANITVNKIENSVKLRADAQKNTINFTISLYDSLQGGQHFTGIISKSGDKSSFYFQQPEQRQFSLPNLLLSIDMTQILLKKAKAGVKSYKSFYFPGRKLASINAPDYAVITIGARCESPIGAQAKGKGKSDSHIAYWPITMRLYENINQKAGALSSVINFDLYENGIKRNYSLKQGNFTINAKLRSVN